MTTNAPADFTLTDHGTICLLTPNTDAGRTWARTQLDGDEVQRLGEAVAVEPRFVQHIITGIEADNLTVEV